MKIGIFQDLHANIAALKKAIEVFRAYGCQKIYHVGDIIGIGPYPQEVLELAISIPEMVFVMGNHDHWFGFGLPSPVPSYMNEEELAHHRWTHQQIGNDYRKLVQQWKFVENIHLKDGRKISFLHYGYDEKSNWFKAYVKNPNPQNLDHLFQKTTANIIFYGHNHIASDIQGKSRYVNLGSAGCFTKPEVRLGILDLSSTQLSLEKLAIQYDDNGLMEAYETRKVPARAFITSTFITRS